jgi:muramidase (phage lysozyme)
MTTVVDELVIKLGLDNTSFRQQLNQSQENVRKVSDEAQKQAKLIESAGDRAASFFTKLRNEALALFALFVGTASIKNFVQQITAADAASGRLATNLGLSVEELTAWQGAAQRAGGSAEGISNSMKALTQDYQNYLLTGHSQMAAPLNAMGISMLDPKTGQMRPVTEIYKDLADQFSKMSPQEAQARGRTLGMDEGTVQLLMKGRKGVEELLEAQRKLGITTKENSENAIALTNSFLNMRDAITDIGRAIVNDLTPYLTDLLKGMTEWITKNKEWLKQEIAEKVRQFGDWLKSIDWKGIGTQIESFIAQVNKVVEALGGWKTVLEAIFLLWAGEKFLGMIRGIKALLVEMGPLVLAFLAIKTVLDAIEKAEKMTGDPNMWSPNSPFWRDISPEEQQKYPNSPEYRKAHPQGQQGQGWWDWTKNRLGFGPASFTADMSMTPEKKTALDALSVGESGGRYDAQNPGSTAHGRYQFINSTEAEIVSATGVSGSDPASQDKRGWYLMARTYNRATSRDLEADIKAGGHDEEIAAALNKVWPSLPGGSQQNTTMAQWKARMEAGRQRYAAAGTVTQGPAPPTVPIPDPSLLRGSQASAMNNTVNNRTSTSTSTTDTHINGPINIQTAATDVDGIAKGIGPALRKYMPVVEANYGLA